MENGINEKMLTNLQNLPNLLCQPNYKTIKSSFPTYTLINTLTYTHIQTQTHIYTQQKQTKLKNGS